MRKTRQAALVVIAMTATSFVFVAPTASAAAAPRCTTGVLSLTHTRHDIGAGNGVEDLVFTNTGGGACVLGGFPGVAYVARSGRQLGAAADRDGSTNGAITLAPGERTRARLHFINNVSAVPGCYHPDQQAQAVGLRVYPPGSSYAMFVRDRHPACKRARVHLLRIEAVR
jgi:hypothetical protein